VTLSAIMEWLRCRTTRKADNERCIKGIFHRGRHQYRKREKAK
jgi:hypothetical protein